MNEIVVHTCAGDDFVTIQGQVNIDAIISGGEGNDVLAGGGGHDEILGKAGNDILIGGIGADLLDGGVGDDLMISGSTAYDKNMATLDLIMTEWSSSRTYEERVDNIRTGKGPVLKGSKVALVTSGSKQTVFDDGEEDILLGGDDRDWFFGSLTDDLIDKQNDDFWEEFWDVL